MSERSRVSFGDGDAFGPKPTLGAEAFGAKPTLKRRTSDPAVQVPKADTLERTERKLQTFCVSDGNAARRADSKPMQPAALAELHRLHEKWLQKERKQVDDTSEAAMQACWNASPKLWLAYGECPAQKEKAFHTRKFKYYPAQNDSMEGVFNRWTGAVINTKGQKSPGDNAPGQDNFSVAHLDNDWQVICCMDGHGPGGEWPSTRSVRTVPFFLQTGGGSTMLQQGNVEAALLHAFRKAEADLEYTAYKDNVDLQVAGCTAVCCCYQPKKNTVWVATAGDSRVMLIEPGQGAVRQTIDHKPSLPEEKKRVEQLGCDVKITTYDDGWVEERINIKDRDYPGISMTRSFGDLLVKDYGVIAEPEVVEWNMDGLKRPYLFAASDGVWEFLETQEVASILLDAIARGDPLDKACKEVLKTSRSAWQRNEDTYCDDITMVLLPLQGIQRLDVGAAGGCVSGLSKSCAGCTIS